MSFMTLKSSVLSLISSCLIFGGVPTSPPPQKALFGFQGSNVDVMYINPDPAVWKVFDMGNKPRPDMKNMSLMHTGIKDSKGVNIQPVMSITAWKFPHDDMNLDYFSQYLLKQSPIKETNRVLKDGRLFIQGTTVYNGYTHIISRAFSYSNRVGIDIICDSTDSVYAQVKGAFDSWLRSTQLVPRITSTPVFLPDQPNSQAKAEAAEASPRTVEKQQPGGPLEGDVAGIKDSDGMVIVWNRSTPYFKLKVEGNEFAGYGPGGVWFKVDGVVLQVKSTETTEFCSATPAKSPEAVLLAHRDWEYRYMQEVLGVKCALQSWAGKLDDGTPILYWDVTPETTSSEGASKHLFCTRFLDGSVVVLYSVETKDVSLDRAKNLIFFGITHIEFSKEKINFQNLQKELAAGKP